MSIALRDLPFPLHALEPHISQRTMEYHYGRHHASYVKNLNQLIGGTPLENLALEEIILRTAGSPAQRAIFNNSAQAWNHEFFWNSMRHDGGRIPEGPIAGRIRQEFGTYADFRKAFIEAAVGHFTSGWVWLVAHRGELAVVALPNAGNPLTQDVTPLLVCDVWEHAYYLDYQNERKAFVEAFLDHLVNWEVVALRLAEAESVRTCTTLA